MGEAKAKGATVVIGGEASPMHGELHYQPTILQESPLRRNFVKKKSLAPLFPFRSFQTRRRRWTSLMTAGPAWPATSTAATSLSAGGWGRLYRPGWLESTRG